MITYLCFTFFKKNILQDLSPIRSTPEDKAAQKIEDLKTKLLAIDPTQRDIQLDAITRVIEGSGTVVDIKLPTQAQQTQGRPKGMANKPKSTTTKRDPSLFKHVEKSARRRMTSRNNSRRN